MNNIYKNLEKVVVNVGIGRLSSQPNFDKNLPAVIEELGFIVGQRPATRGAKQSIAGFKLRANTVVGLKATLRGKRMEEFLKKFINVVLPRVRDFRGIDKKVVDKNGNLSLGVKEHTVFPEISPEISKVNFGLEITLVPKLKIDDKNKAVEFYKELGIPFSVQSGSASGRKKEK